MHHIYHTEGIILSSRNYGEAGKCYYIFTRDLGLVFASAQGVRKLASRLRYVLQDYSCIKVDLVRGRDFWRLTSASKADEDWSLAHDRHATIVFARIAKLTLKLVAGEESNQLIFEDLLSGMRALGNADNRLDVENIELVLVLRLLKHLGYLGSIDLESADIASPFEAELLINVFKNRKKILSEINRALRETHL